MLKKDDHSQQLAYYQVHYTTSLVFGTCGSSAVIL